MRRHRPILTSGDCRLSLRCSPKNYLRELVPHRMSGYVREPSQIDELARTPVGGNELKAARCTNATGRGAISLKHEPTMSASGAPSNEGDDYVLTIEQVAKRYSLCRRTIEREIRAKRFPQPMRIGRALRFLKNELLAYERKAMTGMGGPSQP